MKIQLLKIILTWLTFWFYPKVDNRNAAIDELLIKVQRWSETKGMLWVILHLKEIRLLYTRHQCGDPVYVSKHLIGIRKDGLPKAFPLLNEIYLRDRDGKGLSFVLTLLSISRCIPAWKDPSTETITAPYTGIDVESYRDRVVLISKKLGIKPFQVEWTPSDHYYSIKAGPNGLSTFSAPWDAIQNGYKILQPIREFSTDLANLLLLWSTYSESLKTYFISKNRKSPVNLLRKLSIVKDPEGKSRVIAIFDYWSQSILKLIHNKCFSYLKDLDQDRTFSQDPTVTFQGPYYSYDLSAATDRFPLQFQMLLVEHLLGKEKADAWRSLMVDSEFYVPWTGKTVKYSVGQPMGAYSSWAIFALCHHIVVQIAALEVGEYPTKNYILLGDDIVIGGSALANAYRRHMELLGVEISTHKSHVSSNTYEFAKRWIRDGVEISGIQVSAFISSYKNYSLMYMTLRQYLERGFIPYGFRSLSELIFTLNIMLGKNIKFSLNIMRKVDILHALYRWIHHDDTRTIRNLLVNVLPEGAPVPEADSPHLIPYLSMRLESVLAGAHSRLLKSIDSLGYRYEKQLKAEFSVNWSEGLGGDTLSSPNPEFHGDVLGVVRGDFIGPGGLTNLPVVQALNNLTKRLNSDYRLYRPEQNFKEAINALCLPDIARIGSTKTNDSNKLLVTKIAREFINSCKLYMTDSNLQYSEENFFNIDSDFTRIAAAAVPTASSTTDDWVPPADFM